MSRIQRFFVNGVAAAGLAGAAACAAPAANPADLPGACADLTALELIDMRIGAARARGRRGSAGPLQGHGGHRDRDQLRAAAARRLERSLPDGGRGRLCGQRAEPGAPALRLGREPARARLRDGGDRHRAHGARPLGRLGPRPSRAAGELRPPRRPPDGGDRKVDHLPLLRPAVRVRLLRRLLARRRARR